MGGKAFAAHGRPVRLATRRMAPMAAAIAQAVGARVVPWLSGKEEHGDIDLVVPRSTVDALGDAELARLVGRATGTGYVSKRPDVRDPILFVWPDLPEGVFQVDLIATPDEHVDFRARYLSWGDCGSMIGRVAREMGLKFGMDGLQLPVYGERGSGRENVLLTSDFDAALAWLGLDPERHARGFADDAEVAAFLADGRFFDPRIYHDERATSDARRRGRERKGREAFTALITTFPARFEWPAIKGPSPLQDEFVARAIERFGAADQVEAARARIAAQTRKGESAYTPAAVRAACGADDVDIRRVTAVVMEDFTESGSFPAWKAAATPEDVRARVERAYAIMLEREPARIAREERRGEERRLRREREAQEKKVASRPRLPLSYVPTHVLDVAEVMAIHDEESIRQVCGPDTGEAELRAMISRPVSSRFSWAVTLDGEIVGTVNFDLDHDVAGRVHFGVHVARAHRRRGIASQAFRELSVPFAGDVVRADCWADNAGIMALLPALGFKRRGGSDGIAAWRYVDTTTSGLPLGFVITD